MLRRFLQSAVPVRAGEGRLTLVLFVHGLLAVGAFVAGRSVRDALYLIHADRAQLPWMYVLSAVVVAAVGFAYNPLAAQVRRDKLTVWTAVSMAAGVVALWWLERTQQAWVYPALYVYVEVMGALVVMQFWTLCNEVWNPREAKRLYGLIGAGGTLSNIVIGLLTSTVARRFGTSALLLLCGALLLATAAAGFVASRVGRERLVARIARGGGRGAESSRRGGGLGRILESGHLRSIAMLIAVTFLTTTLVDFEFKVIASDSYDKGALAAFFGEFYAVVGVLALGLQLFGTGRLLTHLGVIGSLAILPVSLLFANAAVVAFRSLWAATLSKGSDALFRYSVNDATTQILYLPVSPAARASAKAFIDGVIKPAAITVGGLLLLAYRTWFSGSTHQLGWITVAMSALWIAVVWSARSHYIASLQATLRKQRLDLGALRYRVQDASTAQVMIRALRSEDLREVQGALDLLPELEGLHLDAEVEALLAHPAAEVRIAALAYFGRRLSLRAADAVLRRFEDAEPAVRAKAIEVFCALGGEKAVPTVRPYLGDPHPDVRAAAVTGVIRHGGLDGVASASATLQALIRDADPRLRARAAIILGDVGAPSFHQPVLDLLRDPDLHVRRGAIQAAARLRSPELILPLLQQTRSPDVAIEAADALAAYGDGVIPTLAQVLSSPLEDPAIRRGAARVLGKLGGAEAVAVITRHLDEPDEGVRTRLFRSFARCVRAQRTLVIDRGRVIGALDAELLRAARTLAQAEALGLGRGPGRDTPREGREAAAALLSSALTEKVALYEQRSFLLLSVLYPDAGMERIYAGIRDASAQDAGRRRANAVELLDNLLDRGLRRVVLPLVEDCARADKLAMLREALPVPAPAPEEALAALCADEAAWVRACAQYFTLQAPSPAATEVLVAGVTDPSPIVREIALVGCARLAPEQAEALIRPRLGDDAALVRRRAELLTRARA